MICEEFIDAGGLEAQLLKEPLVLSSLIFLLKHLTSGSLGLLADSLVLERVHCDGRFEISIQSITIRD